LYLIGGIFAFLVAKGHVQLLLAHGCWPEGVVLRCVKMCREISAVFHQHSSRMFCVDLYVLKNWRGVVKVLLFWIIIFHVCLV
jgi:adenosine/AMP kinase